MLGATTPVKCRLYDNCIYFNRDFSPDLNSLNSFFKSTFMKHPLRIILSVTFMTILSISTPINASPVRGNTSLDVLRKEVIKLVQNNSTPVPDVVDQVVTVGFLINAKKELIILDVNGDSAPACEYVKQLLNYNKVKYNQARQLTRYSIKIRLVSGKY